MSEIPSKLNILGTWYSVEMEKPSEEECGTTEVYKRLIRIDPGLLKNVQVETFYHELMHAILGHTGLQELLTPEVNEAVAQGVGMSLAYILSANELPTLRGEE